MRTTSGHFNLREITILKHLQPSMSIDDQIENLKSKGLTISNEEFAHKILNDVSYYRLIKGFSIGLKEKNGNYHTGVSVEQIISLYLFNAKLRQLLFSKIEVIEINLRTRLSNHICENYGVLGYKDPSIMPNEEYHASLLNDIEREIKRNSRSPFIRNFKDNYENGDVPFYALAETLSFGTLSRLYKNLNTEDKASIASIYHLKYSYLESWIETIAYVRNLCAHYGRLYNVKLTKTPKLYQSERKANIGNQRIFGVICCMKYLIQDRNDWNEFVNELDTLIAKYQYVNTELMGFTNDWKSYLLFDLNEDGEQ